MKIDINDNELIELANENNEEAEKEIINKYDKVINKYVLNNLVWAKSSGLDEKDLYQEGLLGILYAIKNFDKEKNVTFYTYACLCIDTNIRSYIRSANRYKSKILNESLSLEKILEDEDVNLYNNLLKDEESDPSIQIISKEENENFMNLLETTLTTFEKEVLKLRIEGLSNEEISIMLNKDKRSIENTISRIRTKYKMIK